MNKRWLLNLSLLSIIAILAAVALWQPGIKQTIAVPLVTSIQASAINHIVISGTNASVIELQQNDGHWKMVQPVAGRANAFVVNEALRVLTAKIKQTLPPEAAKQLHRYGLDKPRARVRFNQLELLYGDTNPVSKLQYVLVQDRVAMIYSPYYWATVRTYTQYLSKRLIEKSRKPVALSLPSVRLSLDNGTWQTYPVQKELSADRVKQLVDQWRYAQALSVRKYRNDRVVDWVRMSFANEKSRLRIGILSRSPELVLYRPDEKLQYHFPEEVGKRLFSFSD